MMNEEDFPFTKYSIKASGLKEGIKNGGVFAGRLLFGFRSIRPLGIFGRTYVRKFVAFGPERTGLPSTRQLHLSFGQFVEKRSRPEGISRPFFFARATPAAPTKLDLNGTLSGLAGSRKGRRAICGNYVNSASFIRVPDRTGLFAAHYVGTAREMRVFGDEDG